MFKWVLRLWHRFTLGRTALVLPPTYRNHSAPGSLGDIAFKLFDTCLEAKPASVHCEIAARRATDLERGKLRIVIEHNN